MLDMNKNEIEMGDSVLFSWNNKLIKGKCSGYEGSDSIKVEFVAKGSKGAFQKFTETYLAKQCALYVKPNTKTETKEKIVYKDRIVEKVIEKVVEKPKIITKEIPRVIYKPCPKNLLPKIKI